MSLSTRDRNIGIILIVVGILFIINNFDFFDFGDILWRLSPLLLVWWGFHLLRKRGKTEKREGDFQVFGDTVESTSSQYVKHSSAFGDIRIKVECDEFSGGSVSSVFGKISIA